MPRLPLTRDQVEDGYKLVLGRAPESDTVVELHQQNYSDERALWVALLNSDEFVNKRFDERERRKFVLQPIRQRYEVRDAKIQHEVSADVMSRLVKRIQDQWTLLGEEDPHWSVLTADQYRAEKLDAQALASFNESGRDHAGLIEHFETRTGSVASKGVCLELGCGVGRVTRFLAGIFDEVVALDISPGNLALCNSYMAEQGVTNVTPRQISTLSDFENLPEFDFFYSIIVLQHNSPPIQKAILDAILGKIRPGGGALFQIPTDLLNYTFDAESYLASKDEVMEVHALPRHVVFELLAKHGLEIRDVAADGFTGLYGSETFYAVKPKA